MEHSSIRYFGSERDITPYRKGHGLLGALLWALNFLRAWLEKQMALMLLKIELKEHRFSLEEQKAVIEAARTEPDFQPFSSHQPSKRFMRLVRERIEAAPPPREEFSVQRYGEGRKNVSPQALEESEAFIAALTDAEANRIGRSSRYFRRSWRLMEVESEDGSQKAPTEQAPAATPAEPASAAPAAAAGGARA